MRLLVAAVAALLGGTLGPVVMTPAAALLLLPVRLALARLGVRFDDDDDFDRPSLLLIDATIGLGSGAGIAASVILAGLLTTVGSLSAAGIVGGGLASVAAALVAHRLAMPGASAVPAFGAGVVVGVPAAVIVAALTG